MQGHFDISAIQYIAEQSWYLIPGLTLIASLTGSVHCLAMCGGFASIIKADKQSLGLYHMGRLITYSLLGGLAGLGGHMLLHSMQWASMLATVMLSFSFIYLGIQVWKQGAYHLSLPKGMVKFVQRHIVKSMKSSHPLAGLVVGFMSGFLPCGWLYSFILAAIATQHVFLGAGLLLFFWLGTVPILTLSPKLFQTLLLKAKPLHRNIGASCLVLAGVVTLVSKFGMHSMH